MSLFGQPFGSNYTDLQNQYLQQLQVMQQAQQKTQPILDEINREVGSLSVDEQNVLAKTQEYVNSPDGKVAAENLLATIRKSIYNLRLRLKKRRSTHY